MSEPIDRQALNRQRLVAEHERRIERAKLAAARAREYAGYVAIQLHKVDPADLKASLRADLAQDAASAAAQLVRLLADIDLIRDLAPLVGGEPGA